MRYKWSDPLKIGLAVMALLFVISGVSSTSWGTSTPNTDPAAPWRALNYHKGEPVGWQPCRTITWSIIDDGIVPARDARKELVTAFATIQPHTGFHFEFAGYGDQGDIDIRYVVDLTHDGQPANGTATVPPSKQYESAALSINADNYSRQSTLQHEIAHALGLDHTYSGQLMDGGAYLRELQPGDIAGLNAVSRVDRCG